MPGLSRRQMLDGGIVILTVLITVFGLAMLMSATSVVAVQRASEPWYYVKHQFLYGVLPGLFLFGLLAFIDVRRWRSLAFFALFLSIGLLGLVYLPGIGVEHGGARSWVEIGSLRFQPSEFVKLTFLFYLAAWLSARRGAEATHPRTGLLPFVLALGAVMFLLILQPDTGSMTVIVGSSLILYFISGAPVSWFLGLCALGLGSLALLIKFSPYRAARFMTFLHPELDPLGIGYHINQALLAIGSGGWWGLGYGHSRQKYLYLPEVEADSIAAVMGEELGFLGMLVFIILLSALIWRCFYLARTLRDRFAAYLASGVGAWIAIQALMNLGSMTGLIPMTGVTLPFVSHGGSSMTVLLGAMGLVAGLVKAQKTEV